MRKNTYDSQGSGKSDVKFIDKLTTWGDVIRKTYFDGGVDEIISTRRLGFYNTSVCYIFDNKMKAIQMCTNRFDDDTKILLLSYIQKLTLAEVSKTS